jgi:sec-independent protein translocase protein TatA
MGNFGFREILIILLILVILFGAKRIPELARGMGRGVKEFKDGMAEGQKPEPKQDPNEEKKQP